MAAKKYYAYFIPETGAKGIVEGWRKCEQIVSGKKGVRFKGFPSKEEAEEWLGLGAEYGTKIVKPGLPKGIYFDAGTGRGQGVEISVTDEKGNDLLMDVLPKKHINRFGKHWIFQNVTNNYGELLAFKYALDIAMKRGIKKIWGDSKLVIEYWSKGIIKGAATPTLPSLPSTKKAPPQGTINLALTVTKLRNKFEKMGGSIKYISGEDNPADLGFHR